MIEKVLNVLQIRDADDLDSSVLSCSLQKTNVNLFVDFLLLCNSNLIDQSPCSDIQEKCQFC